eukprot:361982-Chlamydomonas_euryale.AAC.8
MLPLRVSAVRGLPCCRCECLPLAACHVAVVGVCRARPAMLPLNEHGPPNTDGLQLLPTTAARSSGGTCPRRMRCMTRQTTRSRRCTTT